MYFYEGGHFGTVDIDHVASESVSCADHLEDGEDGG
jgi:hypothetical protein